MEKNYFKKKQRISFCFAGSWASSRTKTGFPFIRVNACFDAQRLIPRVKVLRVRQREAQLPSHSSSSGLVRGFIDLAFRITQVILDAPPCCISELSHLPAVCNPVQQSSPRVRTRTSHVHSSLRAPATVERTFAVQCMRTDLLPRAVIDVVGGSSRCAELVPKGVTTRMVTTGRSCVSRS